MLQKKMISEVEPVDDVEDEKEAGDELEDFCHQDGRCFEKHVAVSGKKLINM